MLNHIETIYITSFYTHTQITKLCDIHWLRIAVSCKCQSGVMFAKNIHSKFKRWYRWGFLYICHDLKLLSWPVCSIKCFNRCLIRLYILPLISLVVMHLVQDHLIPSFSSAFLCFNCCLLTSCVRPSYTILDKMQNDSDWGIEKQTGKDGIRWS